MSGLGFRGNVGQIVPWVDILQLCRVDERRENPRNIS
jgi:hypothetical protein